MPILLRRCQDCATRYEVLWHRGSGLELSKDLDPPACPDCGADFEGAISLLSAGSGIWMGDEAGVGKIYPYYSHALQTQLHSHKHREQVMREKGVFEGCVNEITREVDRRTREEDAAIARMEATEVAYEEDPAYRDYKKLRDRGAYGEYVNGQYVPEEV